MPKPRAEIVRLGAERCAAAAGLDVATARVVVIGDTEHDVRAARAIGARAIGVATSDPARRELESMNADAIVSSCCDDLVNAVWD